MRQPTTHRLLAWFGPSAAAFIAAYLTLIAAFSQVFDGVKNWAEAWYFFLYPIISAPWFITIAVLAIGLYIWALVWTGRGESEAQPIVPTAIPVTDKAELPCWKAIEQIASCLADYDEQNSYERSRIALRQAALEGRVEIWGRHELAPPHRPGFHSDVWSRIEPSYWKGHAPCPLAVDKMWVEHDHTWAQPLVVSVYRNRYWSLRVKQSEIDKEWPRAE